MANGDSRRTNLYRGDEVQVWAQGRSFLRYMVRNLVGTLVDCGLGRLEPAAVAEILASGERSRAGATAPAHGLCLERIDYPEVPGPPGDGSA